MNLINITRGALQLVGVLVTAHPRDVRLPISSCTNRPCNTSHDTNRQATNQEGHNT